MFPSTLKEIRGGVFTSCRNLRRVVLNEGLERLESDGEYEHIEVERGYEYEFIPYDRMFERCGLEEIVLPSTLKEICGNVFKGCPLKIIRVDEGYPANIREIFRRFKNV